MEVFVLQVMALMICIAVPKVGLVLLGLFVCLS